MSEQAKPKQTSVYEGIKYALEEMQLSGVYASRKTVLKGAQDAITGLEGDLYESQQAIAGLTSAANKVCAQRDALLSALKELVRLDDRDTPVYPQWKKDWHRAIDSATKTIASIESNQPISTPMSERERDLLACATGLFCMCKELGQTAQERLKSVLDDTSLALSRYQEV